jgi:hypothetical protein
VKEVAKTTDSRRLDGAAKEAGRQSPSAYASFSGNRSRPIFEITLTTASSMFRSSLDTTF